MSNSLELFESIRGIETGDKILAQLFAYNDVSQKLRNMKKSFRHVTFASNGVAPILESLEDEIIGYRILAAIITYTDIWELGRCLFCSIRHVGECIQSKF